MSRMTARAMLLIRQRLYPTKSFQALEPYRLAELAHSIDKGRFRFEIPVSLLRMQGGYAYGLGHPFVLALTEGRQSLEAFYSRVRPHTIGEYYDLAGDERTGADLPPWELPWYLRAQRLPPPGELGLGPDEGVSFYGPATSRKVDLEMQRLNRLRDAISREGYAPDAFGDIEGYVLRDGEEVAFFVRGGKHRAAVLAAMGRMTIPVAFRQGFPRMVDTSQVDVWPLVRSGAMDRGLARDLMRIYVRGRSVKGTPG